jgi:hypothetical protein
MEKTTSPRIIVLGIDGLEYNLVEKWRLKNIMQKTYCKLDLSDYKVIATPPIWGSMITGKIDEEIMKIWEKASEIISLGNSDPDIKPKWWTKKWWTKLGMESLPTSVKEWIWKSFLEKKIIGGSLAEISANYVIEKKQTNIFQFFEKPWTNGIPSYRRAYTDSTEKKLLNKVFREEKTPFVDYVTEIYKSDKMQLFSALDSQDNDIIFWFASLLDKLGHIYIKSPLTLMNYYLEINEVVGKVKEKCNDSRTYVISDHGMEPYKGIWGMHSDHAFFSSNTGETIDKPLQLYNLILKHKND